MVADRNVQVSAPCQLLFAVHLGDSGAQLMVGLDAVFRAVDVALQLRVTKVAKRVDAANQLVELKEVFEPQPGGKVL